MGLSTGIVDAVGAGKWPSRGEAVMGIVSGGAMATHLVVHEREAMRIPAGLTLVEAAAVPEVFLTAYDALFALGGLTLGQVVLVHAVASGVGTAALQLARVAGATVVGTSRTEDKIRRCLEEFEMDHGIVVRDGQFADELKEITGGRLAEVVIDTVGASYLEENVRAVARRGHIVIVGLLGGARRRSLGPMLAKRVHLKATVLRNRSLRRRRLAQSFARDVILCSRKEGCPNQRGVPMSEIMEAHRRKETNEPFGKIGAAWAEA